MKRFALAAAALALAGLIACDQVLGIQPHHLAPGAGADSGSSGDAGGGDDAGCQPCVLDTTTVDFCCVQ